MKKKNVENYQTHSSRVSFKTKISVTCDKIYLFFVFVGAEILQSFLFVLTLFTLAIVLSRHDYILITHLRNIYLVSKMPAPIFLSIGYTKSAITDDDSHYRFY